MTKSNSNIHTLLIYILLAITLCTSIGWFLQYKKCQRLTSAPPVETYIDDTTGDEIIVGDGKSAQSGKPSYILIDKQSMTLSLIDDQGRPIMRTGIACGKCFGDKIESGDNRTPQGIFHVQEIQDASGWKHDFGDGNGEIEGAYGSWFIRLATPGHRGIGIHGTHDPASIGTRASEGCIRLNNDDLDRLKPLVKKDMRVVIVPSDSDEKADNENSKRADNENSKKADNENSKKAD